MHDFTRQMMMAAAGQLGIEFVSDSRAWETSVTVEQTSLAINKPGEAQPGDTMVAFLWAQEAYGSIAWTPPTGWAEHLDTGGLSIMTKSVTGTEGASFTFNMNRSDWPSGRIVLFRGGAVIDVIGSPVSTSGTSVLNAPSINAEGGILLALAYGKGHVSRNYSDVIGMTATGPGVRNNGNTVRICYELIGGGDTGIRSITPTPAGGGTNFARLISLKVA